MAIELTQDEELAILRRRQDALLREEIKQKASVSAPPPVSQNSLISWGGVVKGVKTIIKIAVISIVAIAGFALLTGAAGAVLTANPSFAPVLGPVVEAMTSVNSFINGMLGTVGSYISGIKLASAAEAGSLGTTIAGASVVGGGAAMVASQKATIASTMTTGPDTTALLSSKKSALAAGVSTSADTLMALPDSPVELTNASRVIQGMSAHDSTIAQKAAMKNAVHAATDLVQEKIHQSRALTAVERVQQAQQSKGTWAERVTAPTADSTRTV